jgi:hypothetical protein
MDTKIAILSAVLALGLSAGFAVAATVVPQPQAISPQQLTVQPPPINIYNRAPVIGEPYNLGDGYVNRQGFPLGGWSQLISPLE